MERCDFRTYQECTCGPNECRVQMVYPKANDMAGVFTVSARGQIAFIAWFTLTCLIGFGAYQLHQIDKQAQIARNV